MSQPPVEPNWKEHHPAGLRAAWAAAVAFNVQKTHYALDPITHKPWARHVSAVALKLENNSGLTDFDLSTPRAVLGVAEACQLFARLAENVEAKQWRKLLALAGNDDDRLHTILEHVASGVAEFDLEKERTATKRRKDIEQMGRAAQSLARSLRLLGFDQLTVPELLTAEEDNRLFSSIESTLDVMLVKRRSTTGNATLDEGLTGEFEVFSREDGRMALSAFLPSFASLLERIGDVCKCSASEWRIELQKVRNDGKQKPLRAHVLKAVYATLKDVNPNASSLVTLARVLADAVNETHASELLTYDDARDILGLKKKGFATHEKRDQTP